MKCSKNSGNIIKKFSLFSQMLSFVRHLLSKTPNFKFAVIVASFVSQKIPFLRIRKGLQNFQEGFFLNIFIYCPKLKHSLNFLYTYRGKGTVQKTFHFDASKESCKKIRKCFYLVIKKWCRYT